MSELYASACDQMWADATQLHGLAKTLGLNRSENLDRAPTPRPSTADRLKFKQLGIPKGYSRHLSASTRRDKYDNGYWLREKVFADIRAYSKLDRATLERLYCTGRIQDLCEFVGANYRP